jgi:ribosomal protein S12 methylthiotransferase accessory factor
MRLTHHEAPRGSNTSMSLREPTIDDHPLMGLAGPYGPVTSLRRVNTTAWMPAECSLFVANAGHPDAIAGNRREKPKPATGAGRAYSDIARARLLAVSEALERYATRMVDEDDLVTAAAEDLGPDAMDLELVPRCSDRELKRAGCPVRNPSRNVAIRWSAGIDLQSGRDIYIPATMVYLMDAKPSEQFWIPISTGAAAHKTLTEAIINGILELIERDAIALTWLQRLSLPPLAAGCISAEAASIIGWLDRRGVATHLFDATTEIGIPTVYCLLTTRDERISNGAQIIGCATEFDPGDAAMHALLEALGMRLALHTGSLSPRGYADYEQVIDGAHFMGRRARRPAFGFLLDGFADRGDSTPAAYTFDSSTECLDFLLKRLAELKMSVYAVDTTTLELDAVGVAAVRVVIPQLQPMSLRPLVQYRANPRLYSAPAKMGMDVLPERKTNPYPQPMA